MAGPVLLDGEAEKSKKGFVRESKRGSRGMWEGDVMEEPKVTKRDASLGNALQAVCSP